MSGNGKNGHDDLEPLLIETDLEETGLHPLPRERAEIMFRLDKLEAAMTVVAAKTEYSGVHLAGLEDLVIDLRRDLQAFRDDVREVREYAKKIPAIFEILGELMAHATRV